MVWLLDLPNAQWRRPAVRSSASPCSQGFQVFLAVSACAATGTSYHFCIAAPLAWRCVFFCCWAMPPSAGGLPWPLANMSARYFTSPQSILWGGYILLVVAVIVGGDSLSTAYLYPLLAPIVTFEICSWAEMRPYYLAGVSVVMFLTILIYLSINWFSSRPEGLLVLGHLFSLPGLILGAIAFSNRDRTGTHGYAASVFLGIVGASIGFSVAQGVTCNTVMYCGALSFY